MRCNLVLRLSAIAGATAVFLAAASPAALAQTPQPPASSPQQASPPPTSPTDSTGKRPLTINVPEAGSKFVRILPSADGKQQAQLPTAFSDKKVVVMLDLVAVGKTPRVAVDDEKTGNTAIKAVPESGEITLMRPDFDHVHNVKVKVTYDNKPVQIARVTLNPFDKASQTKVIDAAHAGVAEFQDVAAGKATLTLVYGDNFTQTQDVVITTDHPGTSLEIPAPVSNKVATADSGAPAGSPLGGTGTPGPVSPQVSSPAGPLPTTPPADTGGGIGGMIGNLIALAVVGGGIYLFWKWFQSGGFTATMKKAGIEVSGPTPPSDAGTPWQPNAPATPVIADPTVCQFCGQKKDAGGNCACSLTPGAGLPAGGTFGGGAAGSAVSSQPRLVATMGVYSGTVFPLNINGTGVTLGRDTTNSIPLDNDTTVSRRHASIRGDGNGYTVVDEGSSNGVYVNGVRISGSQALRPGDEVQIGNTRFRFEL
jgi:hypothetical protein